MNLLIIDAINMGLDLAIRAKHAGHNVRLFSRHNKDGSRSEIGDGIVQRVSNWEDHMTWADLTFVTDNILYIHKLDAYRNKGYPIFGCDPEGRMWEQDRLYGDSIFQRAGIQTIPITKFKNYDEAIAFITKNPNRYVSKPIGDGDKALSYCSKSPADMIFMLQSWKKRGAYKGEFILQEFHKGIEMAVGGWMGAGGFSQHFLENWEFKKLMNGDLGVATGEQGTILRYTKESKLADMVLKPLEGMLHGIGYVGYIDVNCIIDSSGVPWPLEFTTRPGWPLFQIQQSLHKGDPIEWMLDAIDGKDTLKVSSDVACGVVISMPDYPYNNVTKKENSGYPLFGMTEEDLSGCIHASEVQMGKGPTFEDGKLKFNQQMLVTAGELVCTVSGTGPTVSAASEKAYKNIKNKIEVPNSIMYRTDIGCRLEDQLPQLNKMGFCKDLSYG